MRNFKLLQEKWNEAIRSFNGKDVAFMWRKTSQPEPQIFLRI